MRRFLIVQRLPVYRKELLRELTAKGLEVAAAVSGAEALAAVKAAEPDCLLVDPETLEPAEWLTVRPHCPDARVVLWVKGNTDEAAARSLIQQYGAMGAVGRQDTLPALMKVLSGSPGELVLSPGEAARAAQERARAAFRAKARTAPIEQLAADPEFLRLVWERLDARSELKGPALQLYSLLEMKSWSASSGVGFYFSHASSASARAVAQAFAALGWRDDAAAFEEILGMVGEALGDDAAEELLEGDVRPAFEAAVRRLRVDDPDREGEVEAALRAFVLDHRGAFG